MTTNWATPLCRHGARVANLPDDLDFQQPQLPVSDNEEIAATAGRIKECQPPDLLLKPSEFGPTPTVLAGLQSTELGMKVVHEQRLNHLEDVLLGRIVRPFGAAFRRVHYRLKQGTENRGRDDRPVEAASIEQCPAHCRIE